MKLIALFLLCYSVMFLSSFNASAGNYKNVVVVNNDTSKILGTFIKTVQFKENGFKTKCSYPEVIEYLKNLAIENHANIIYVTKHKKPDVWSSCHRITADLYNVPDANLYEKEIVWNEDRKIDWDDFKGEKTSLDIMSAESHGGFGWETNNFTLLSSIKYYVKAYFTPAKSYVTAEGKNSQDLLNHEQKHFDIWEVYARKLYKELTENKKYKRSLAHTYSLFVKLRNECNDMQNKYDIETNHSKNQTAQEEWNKKIEKELADLKEYANHY